MQQLQQWAVALDSPEWDTTILYESLNPRHDLEEQLVT